MQRTRRNRVVAGIGSLGLLRPLYVLYGTPGLLDDGAAWWVLLSKGLSVMTLWEVVPTAIGIACLAFLVTPSRFRFWQRRAARSASRVPTTIDHEQSQAWLMAGRDLTVAVFVTLENHLDIAAEVRSAELTSVMKRGAHVVVRMCAFEDGEDTAGDGVAVGSVLVPARGSRRGWLLFIHNEPVRLVDLRHFELQIQVIGEPAEVHRMEPYDGGSVRSEGSRLVLGGD